MNTWFIINVTDSPVYMHMKGTLLSFISAQPRYIHDYVSQVIIIKKLRSCDIIIHLHSLFLANFSRSGSLLFSFSNLLLSIRSNFDDLLDSKVHK